MILWFCLTLSLLDFHGHLFVQENPHRLWKKESCRVIPLHRGPCIKAWPSHFPLSSGVSTCTEVESAKPFSSQPALDSPTRALGGFILRLPSGRMWQTLNWEGSFHMLHFFMFYFSGFVFNFAIWEKTARTCEENLLLLLEFLPGKSFTLTDGPSGSMCFILIPCVFISLLRGNTFLVLQFFASFSFTSFVSPSTIPDSPVSCQFSEVIFFFFWYYYFYFILTYPHPANLNTQEPGQGIVFLYYPEWFRILLLKKDLTNKQWLLSMESQILKYN